MTEQAWPIDSIKPMTVQVRGDSLVEIVGDILVTLDAANPLNCDTIAAKLLEGLETCGVEVTYDN